MPIRAGEHWILNSGSFEGYPKVKAAIRDLAEQMRHKSDPMGLDEVAGPEEDEYDGPWEEMHTRGRAKRKRQGDRTWDIKGTREGLWHDDRPAGRQGGAERTVGTGGSRTLLVQLPCRGKKGHQGMHCGRAKGNGGGKKGAYGVDDEAVEVAEPQGLGDLEDECVVVKSEGRLLGHPGAFLSDDFPPGFIDLGSSDPWVLYTDPTSSRDTWAD